MSKKPRKKKKYHPRAISVPPYLNTIDKLTGQQSGFGREDDRIALLKIANRTATNDDLVMRIKLFQAAWVLAARMEQAKALRECLHSGIEAIGSYISVEHEDFTDEMFENLVLATETCRDIIEASGKIERTQAMATVMHGQCMIGVDEKQITDAEVRL